MTRNDLILQQVVPLPWRGMVTLPRPAAYHWKVVEITDTKQLAGDETGGALVRPGFVR